MWRSTKSFTLSVAGVVGLEVPICDSAQGVGTRATSRKTASYAKLYDAKEFALSSSASSSCHYGHGETGLRIEQSLLPKPTLPLTAPHS
jgi:hypothetical protein